MPLYVVRWPNLSAALVRADGEDDLLDILDEVANPSGCRWQEYDGPVFVDFELAAAIDIEPRADGEPDTGARPLDPARIRLTGVDDLAAHAVPLTELQPAGETGAFMVEEICRYAFPAMADVLWDSGGDDIDRDTLEAALREDALHLVEYTWRRSQLYRSSDPDAQLAIHMDASPQWLAAMRRRAERAGIDDGDIDDGDIDDGDIGDDDDGGDGDEGAAGLMALDEEIGDMLDRARRSWDERGDPETLRAMLAEALDMVTDYEAREARELADSDDR